jgi:signal transduction histidine kinase/DNA-binding response OmpR family regulator
MRLRWHLVILLLAAVIPLLLFTAFVARQHLHDQRDVLDRGMLDATRALSLAIDGEVKASWAVLDTLAGSAFLDRRDLAAFHQLCERSMSGRTSAWIVLFDRTGQQVVNSTRPFGAPLPNAFTGTRPPSSDPAHPTLPLGGADPVRRVFETGGRVVSDLFVALDSRRPTIAVAVPVIRDGVVRYALEMSIDPEVFTRLLLAQRPSVAAVETIVDGRGFILARTRDAAAVVGRPLAPVLASQIATTEEGSGTGRTLEGLSVYHTFSRSPVTRWTTSVAVPRAVVRGAMDRSVTLMLGGGAIVLLLGLGAALVLGKRISTPISTLAAAAEDIARGQRVVLNASGVREVRELRDALITAGEAAREARLEHERRLVAETRREEAQTANQAKDQFLAMLGHELRNPLGAIASAASLLRAPGAGPELTARARAVIDRQIQHLSRLVDDLLDVSRVTSGKIVLEIRPLDLAELVTSTVTMWRSSGRLERHQVSVEVSPVWIDGDRTRVEQVIGNLLTNALKYTPTGGAVTISVGPEGAHAVLRVRDTGIGIAPATLPHIFDLFMQGETGLDRARGGLGIGLTLVRRLIELQGGTVTAESEGDGRGSTFTVRLPAINAPPVAPEVPRRPPEPATAVRLRILVVEDSDDAREMLRAALALRGHEVIEARDGPSAVEMVERIAPDVALIDVGLPGFDGYEVARRVRGLGRRVIRLIAITGYGRPEDRARAQAAGFDAHLVKPVDQLSLTAVLAGGGSAPPRSVGAMARRYDPVEDALVQRVVARRLRQHAQATYRRTRELRTAACEVRALRRP